MIDWQTLVALLIVLAAAGWLVRRIARTVRQAQGKEGSIGCGGCPNRSSRQPESIKSRPLVQLGEKKER